MFSELSTAMATCTINAKSKQVSSNVYFGSIIYFFFFFSYFKQLVHDFKSRWTDRLSQLETPSSADNSQLVPIATRLTDVSQQMNKQNVQIQQQLTALANRLQAI